MKIYSLIFLILFCSCTDQVLEIDKEQLTLGIWYYEYEYQPNTLRMDKNTTLEFAASGTYTRENEVYVPLSPTGNTMVTKVGTWSFNADNQIDLTDFGTCVQPEGGPPCTPSDIDFKIIRLTNTLLEIEEIVDGSPGSRRQYTNIKP